MAGWFPIVDAKWDVLTFLPDVAVSGSSSSSSSRARFELALELGISDMLAGSCDAIDGAEFVTCCCRVELSITWEDDMAGAVVDTGNDGLPDGITVGSGGIRGCDAADDDFGVRLGAVAIISITAAMGGMGFGDCCPRQATRA